MGLEPARDAFQLDGDIGFTDLFAEGGLEKGPLDAFAIPSFE